MNRQLLERWWMRSPAGVYPDQVQQQLSTTSMGYIEAEHP